MFRYTPPWQVLCNSLGHEFKRQSSDSTCDESTQVTRQVVSTDQSHRFLRPPGLSHFPDHSQSRVSMSSTPKRWVIKPFSPKLDQSDLRSMVSPTDPQPSPESFQSSRSRHDEASAFRFSAESISVTGTQPSVIMSPQSRESTPDVLVRARQVAVSEDGSDSEDLSSSGSHNGFYSFVEDPASPEAEMNEAYMASPMRLAKLNTLKEKDTFRLQTYTEEKKPGRLFEEASEETQYHIEKVFTDDREEDNPDRLEIIRNQAPRKSPALKEQWSALENLDLSSTTQRLLEGFSLSYKPAKPKPEQVRSDHGIIECEQIDFNTARKQFLLMEQSQPGSLPQSPQQLPYISKVRGRSLSSTASIFTSEEHKVPVLPTTQKEPELTFVTKTEDPVEAPSAALYDVDHADGAGGNNSDGSNSTLSSVSEIESSFLILSTGETPIQKEIRVAQEREENLRRSRGILRSDSSEMVEIKSKPFLSQSSPRRKAPRAKEPNRVSFLIQQQQQSKDEAWDNLPTSMKTNPKRFTNLQPPSSPEDDSTETLSPYYPHQHPDDYATECKTDSEERVVKENGLGSHSRANRDLSMGIQTSISENKKLHFSKTPSFMNPTKFSYSPTWSSHDEHSNWSSKMQNAPQSIRQEIEEGLRREQELQHFRESNSLCFSQTPSKPRSSLTGTDEASEEFSSQNAQRNDTDVDMMTLERKVDYSSPYLWSGEPSQSSGADKYQQFSSPQPSFRQPSVSIITPQPWVSPKPLSPSVSRLNPIKPLGLLDAPSPTTQKGLTETLLRDYEDRRVKLKLDESAYAGIQPVDEINNEVVEATRVIRHKNQRALQWEAGMYANQESQ